MDKENSLRPYLAGIAFTFIVGFSFLMIKVCIPFAGTIQIMTYRFDFAFIGVAFMWALHRKNRSSEKGGSKKALIIPASFYIGCLALQTAGLVYSTSVEATIIFAVSPLMVQIIASVFFKEKSTGIQIFFVILSAAALVVMVVVGNKMTVDMRGVVLLILAALSMAMYSVTGRYFSGKFEPFDLTTVIVIEGVLVFNAVTLISGLRTGNITDYFAPLANWKFTAAAIYLGIGCIMLSAQLMNYMLKKLHAVNASIFGNASTLVTILAGVLIIGESLRLYQVLCAAAILAGVIGVSVSGEKQRRLEQ